MSRTDDRGVIQSGNKTFQRLAGYEWDDLLGAPHKVIRHPDMPKGVFHLFWDRLKSGKSIGAYVKNRAKDGRFYWVFAIAMPVKDGYVSVRLKPTSSNLGTIKSIYADLIEQERGGLSPADSAGRLLDHLKEAGFASYLAAMSVWVRMEIAARRDALKLRPDQVLVGLDELKETVQKIGAELTEVRSTFESIRGTPTNLRIQASRFGEVAYTIQIISQNYDLLTKDIEAANERMREIYQKLQQILDDDSFGLAAMSLLSEAFKSFESEVDMPEAVSMKREAAIIRPHTEGFGARADAMLKQTEELVVQVRLLQRIVSGLAVTRVMCRIEASGLSGDSGGIADIVDRLLSFQTNVMASIERIDTECRCAHIAMTKLAASLPTRQKEQAQLSGVEGSNEIQQAPAA